MGALRLAYQENSINFTVVSRLKICYVNPRLRAENNTSFLEVVDKEQQANGGGNNQPGSGVLKNTQNAATVTGVGLYAGEGVLRYGANAPTGNVGGQILAKELAAGKYFTRGANVLKLAGRKVFFIGAFVDGYQGVNHLRSGNTEGAVRSGVSIGIGAVMTFGGPIGFFGGLGAIGMQYGIDNGYLTPGVYKPDWQTQGICFVAGTGIQMGDESIKNIEDVVVGDTVLTYNLSTQKIEANAVLQVDKPIHLNLVEISFNNGLMNTNTPDHPYYVKGKGWSSVNPNKTKEHYKMDVDQLEKGDTCFVYDSKNDELLEVVITTVTHKKEETQTYNLSRIANNSNFFANGILVHNKYNPAMESKEIEKEEETQEN